MYKKQLLFALLSLLLIEARAVFAQDKIPKFGKITEDELTAKICPIDSSAHAYYLFDEGSTYMDYAGGRGLYLTTERHFRIKILDSEGTGLANQSVYLYTGGRGDELVKKLKASSFNLENGKIVETEMEKSAINKEKVSEDVTRIKFTIPKARPGSVIEVKYDFESDYIFSIDPWVFQHDYPCIRNKYTIETPTDFTYQRSLNGYVRVGYETERGSRSMATGGGIATIQVYKAIFDAKNVPAFIEESYLYTDKNYRSILEYNLQSVNPLSGFDVKIPANWGEIIRMYKDSESFGGYLKKHNKFKGQAELCKSIPDKTDRAKVCLSIVQKDYNWNGKYSEFASDSPNKVHETKTGNSAAINLALVAMLRQADLEADPILLSTRNNGVTNPLTPNSRYLNHVIASVMIDSVRHYMDATDPLSLLDLMPPNNYNGFALLCQEETYEGIALRQVKTLTSVVKAEMELTTQNELEGKVNVDYVDYGAYYKRNQIRSADNTEQFLSEWAKDYNGFTYAKHNILGADTLDQSIFIQLDANFANNVESAGDRILIQPWLLDYETENPFKSKERLYPVEFDFPISKSSTIKIKIPNGYTVESMPANIRLKLPDSSARFSVSTKQEGQQISVSTTLIISKTTFMPEDYGALSQFFKTIIEKQQERIILKKA
jgi:hypothetical protein